jgi:tetratricopeptide (TPR) repeat protein
MGFEVRKLNVGNDHSQVAASLDDIAGLYQKLGEHDKALLCLKEGLRIRRLQGSNSMEIATTLFAMGIIFAATNDNEKATECYNASLDISCRDGSNPKLEAQVIYPDDVLCID